MYEHFCDKTKKENFLTDEQVRALADGTFVIELKTPEKHKPTNEKIAIGSKMIAETNKDLFFDILQNYNKICYFRNKINHGDEKEIMQPGSYQKHIGVFLDLLIKAVKISADFHDYEFRPIGLK